MIVWIVIFILYMAYRAFAETQKKQSQARRQQREVIYEDVEPTQEVSWDFDPDEYQRKKARVYRVEVEQVPQEENTYQKKLKAIEDKQRDKPKEVEVVEPLAINERREPVSSAFSVQLDHNSLVNAVIMSEILQPPRSKRRMKY